jgi:hypothetical protein
VEKEIEKIQQSQPAGKQKLVWDTKSLTYGIYYFKFQVGEQITKGRVDKLF